MSIFLTPDEVGQLTGYERPADQTRWLRLRHWVFELNARRSPIVLRAYAEERMGLTRHAGVTATTSSRAPSEPNFDAIKA